MIARGTAEELKGQVGGERLEIVVTQPDQFSVAADVLRGIGSDRTGVDVDDRRITVAVGDGAHR